MQVQIWTITPTVFTGYGILTFDLSPDTDLEESILVRGRGTAALTRTEIVEQLQNNPVVSRNYTVTDNGTAVVVAEREMIQSEIDFRDAVSGLALTVTKTQNAFLSPTQYDITLDREVNLSAGDGVFIEASTEGESTELVTVSRDGATVRGRLASSNDSPPIYDVDQNNALLVPAAIVGSIESKRVPGWGIRLIAGRTIDLTSTSVTQLSDVTNAGSGQIITDAERQKLESLEDHLLGVVLDKDLATPPASPASGARYIVAASPTGAWAGQANNVAEWDGSSWTFITPQNGDFAYVSDESSYYTFTGVEWQLSDMSVASISFTGAELSVGRTGTLPTLTATMPNATTSVAGAMSAADKTKLVGIQDNAFLDSAFWIDGANTASAGEMRLEKSGGSIIQAADDYSLITRVRLNETGKVTASGTGTDKDLSSVFDDVVVGAIMYMTSTDEPGDAIVLRVTAVNATVSGVRSYDVAEVEHAGTLGGSGRWWTVRVRPRPILLATSELIGRTPISATERTKLAGIEAGATADQTAAEIKTAYESNSNTNAFTDTQQTKLAGIETGATADQSASEIKTAYESNLNTNAFTDVEQTKLSGIETGAHRNEVEWQEIVISRSVSTPPASPTEGDRYIVGTSPTGAWSSFVDDIVEWNGSSWEVTDPSEGIIVWVSDEDLLYQHNGTSWEPVVPQRAQREFAFGASNAPYIGHSGLTFRLVRQFTIPDNDVVLYSTALINVYGASINAACTLRLDISAGSTVLYQSSGLTISNATTNIVVANLTTANWPAATTKNVVVRLLSASTTGVQIRASGIVFQGTRR